MALRSDVTVDWEADPRVITVASPSVAISLQDLVDTCRFLESTVNEMEYGHLLNAAGKEPLGGSVFVGITVTLQNAILAFEARPGPGFVQCNVSGGNLTAVDEFGADIDPIETTAFTQIVRTSSSSATLQELADIQFASFNGGVWLDAINGVSGVVFPTGTERQPVDTLASALTIATARGFGTIYVLGDLTVTTEDIQDYAFVGESLTASVITIQAAALTSGTTWRNVTVTGEMDGDATFVGSILEDLSMVNGDVVQCGLKGTVTLTGTVAVRMLDCYDAGTVALEPILDLGGAGPELHVLNYQGHLNLENQTGIKTIRVGLGHGKVTVKTGVTDGLIYVTGVGTVVDNSTGSAVVDSSSLVEGAQLQELYSLQGLRLGSPVTFTPTSRVAAAISQVISGDGETTSTVTRQ